MGLDTVEIVLAWEQSFGIALENEDVADLRTPRQAIDLIAAKLGVQDGGFSPCLSMRAFHRLRDTISKTTGVSRGRIRPDMRVRDFLPAPRARKWAEIRIASGIPQLPEPGWFAQHTVASLANWTVRHAARKLKAAGEPWTRGEVRRIVREVIIDVLGVREFSDDDDFVYDLGVA